MFCTLVAASFAAAPVPAPQVYVQALIVSVDADFARKIGWVEKESSVTYPGAWTEEVNACVRAAKAADKIEVYSRPSMLLTPDQTGYFAVGSHLVKNAPQTGRDQVVGQDLPNLQLRVTPTPAADGSSVKMRIETQCTEAQERNSAGFVAFDTEQLQATLSVACGKTVCLPVGRTAGKKTVRLAFLTAYLMASTPALAPAAPPLPMPAQSQWVNLPVSSVDYSVPVRPAPNPFVTPKIPAPPIMPQAVAYSTLLPAKPTPVPPPVPGTWTAYPTPVPIAKPVPEPATLPDLLAAYRAACERQDGAAATRLAVKALALDPTCFK